MMRPLLLRGLVVALLLGSLGVACAADDEDDITTDPGLEPLDTVPQCWTRVKLWLRSGEFDGCLMVIKRLIFLKPTDAELLKIFDKDASTLEKLRTIHRSIKPRDQDEAIKTVEDLLGRVKAAEKKRSADPRIRGLILKLQGTPQERTDAIRELAEYGSLAIPYLIDNLLKATDPGERLRLVQALEHMGPFATAPLVAALDCGDSPTKLDLLKILHKHRHSSKQIVPFLWYFSTSRSEPPSVRREAKETLADFLDMDASRLTPAKVALTREAEKYYRHEVTFGPAEVKVWRWDGKGVVVGWPGASTVPANQAEEYYGLRFARQALRLDPAYRPAQVVMLSMAIDKAVERGGMSAPLSRNAPMVAELLSKSSPDLLMVVLDRALREKRSGVVLATVQSLGQRTETRAKRPTERGDPPLVRALDYPDGRVRLAAAESLVRIPGDLPQRTRRLMVEILARVPTVGPPLTAVEQREAAEKSIRILSSMAQGTPAGYDVKAVTAAILATLRTGGLSPEGQLAAITASSRLPGAGTQKALSGVILDGARTLPVRTAAAAALVGHIQRFSIQAPPDEFIPLRTLAGQAGLDAQLKQKLDVLLGTLRPGDRTTGALLSEYDPTPAAIIPPPPK